jgi:hypothetical protein
MSQRMTKPMMVYQGANDPRVPKSESDQLVQRLRNQGTEVWYVVAADEGHGVSRKANAEVVRAAETLFLSRVLNAPLNPLKPAWARRLALRKRRTQSAIFGSSLGPSRLSLAWSTCASGICPRRRSASALAYSTVNSGWHWKLMARWSV